MMRFEKLPAMATGLTFLTFTLFPQIANACATCGLGANDFGGRAFRTSVLFLMSVPYTTVLVIGGAVYFAWRKAKRHDDSSIAD
jgi:hypothetical protein